MQEERARITAEAEESRRAVQEEQKRAVAEAAAEAAAEACRKARAEADAELVKLRRAVDTTALWYEDLLDTARAERDRCTGESGVLANISGGENEDLPRSSKIQIFGI